MEKAGTNSVFDSELSDLRLAHRAHAQLGHSLVEALGQQAVDHVLLDLGGETAFDHRLRHLTGAEAGNLGIFTVVAGHRPVGLRDLFDGNIEHQLAGAIGIKDRAMLMVVTLVIVAFMAMSVVRVIVIVGGLGRVGLGGVFEGVGRAQRFAFRAQFSAPSTCKSRLLPAAASRLQSPVLRMQPSGA